MTSAAGQAGRVVGVEATDPAPEPGSLVPVDEVVITILVDNTYDALIADTGPARRGGLGRVARMPAEQYLNGATITGLRAEHGFAALVAVRRGEVTRTLLLDTGITADAVLLNADLLGIDLSAVEAVVLSHGHFDHTGGLLAVAGRVGRLPLVLHPLAWTRRRVAAPGQAPMELPTLSREAVVGAGFDIVERGGPSLLLDGQVLVTGQVERTTAFERGMPFHEAYRDGRWVPDPDLLDDQAIVVHVRGRGLVVLTGCGHSGIVNTIMHARRITGVDRLTAVLGGLHLSGPALEPVIAPTIEAIAGLVPEVIVPAHCTGWVAQHRIAEAFPAAFVPSTSGTSFLFAAG